AIFNLDLHRDDANIFKPTRLNLRSTVSEQISQGADHVQYYVNVSIGTPPQPMRLNLDLGASDTVLNIPTSKFCSQASNVCSTYGTYNSNDSSTYDSLNKNFNLTYADGSQLSGNYATDTFHIGNDEVKAFQFGRASSSTIATGVLGIGYAIQEIQVKTNKEQPYPNLPQALANLGLTNSAAYSVWLNDYDSSGGSLLFGGLDKAKYLGELRTIPIVPTTSVDSRFLVSITNIQLGGKTVFDGRNLSAVLDTGTSLTYLPNNVTKQIFDLVGAQYDSTQGAAFVDCAMRENDTTMDITLGWPFINVTMKDLVLDLDVKTKSGAKTCIFGVAPTGDTDFIILGLTALRSAYLVFNLAGNEISIAQSNSNATSSDILEIRNGVDGVPGAIRAPTSIAPAVSTS
ncbi:eukaryotic aspartyl protease, partial [Tothia fuscella]